MFNRFQREMLPVFLLRLRLKREFQTQHSDAGISHTIRQEMRAVYGSDKPYHALQTYIGWCEALDYDADDAPRIHPEWCEMYQSRRGTIRDGFPLVSRTTGRVIGCVGTNRVKEGGDWTMTPHRSL